MFMPFDLTAPVQRFPGPNGWVHVRLDEERSAELRPLVVDSWPALLKVTAILDGHSWTATLMPIKGGPLFIALTRPVRARLGVEVGDIVTLTIGPL